MVFPQKLQLYKKMSLTSLKVHSQYIYAAYRTMTGFQTLLLCQYIMLIRLKRRFKLRESFHCQQMDVKTDFRYQTQHIHPPCTVK